MVDDILKGPCNFGLDIAITCPEFLLVSESKAISVKPFRYAIEQAIAATLKRAYVPPAHTLEETRADKPQRTAAKPKEFKPPRAEEPPPEKGPLGRRLDALCAESGRSASDLLVMSDEIDPYALDRKPGNHKAGAWLRDSLDEAGVGGRIMHVRGCFYALVAHGGFIKPDGKPFTNTAENWSFLQRTAKNARWLGYIAWGQIIDERNTPPIEREAHDGRFALEPTIVASAPRLNVPAYASGTLSVGIDELRGFPHRRQPFRLVIFGEKTGLEPVLGPVADRFGASLYLPSGEISNTMIESMARCGAADGRRSIIFTFSDFDPTGHNMPVNIARKMQAFKDLLYPDLEFEIHPVAMTEGSGTVARSAIDAAEADRKARRRMAGAVRPRTDRNRCAGDIAARCSHRDRSSGDRTIL